jgi:hypothetical protein
LGNVVSRAASHVLRFAMIYALIDGSEFIQHGHLAAALALWDASARCASYIFGGSLGDPIADRILAALRGATDGLTRTQIREDIFQRNTSAARIKSALATLLDSLVIREVREADTGGHPAYRCYSINAVNAKSAPRGTESRVIHPLTASIALMASVPRQRWVQRQAIGRCSNYDPP